MKILVTGGAGFIGSNLCHRLLRNGNEVFCIDNLNTGHIENISNLINNKKFHMIEWDITMPLDIEVDKIYNLASCAIPGQYRINSIDTLKSNIMGMINILDLADKLNIPILQVSTIKVYDTNHLGPDACYVEGKRCAETLALTYQREKNVSVKIVRLFNTYGPKMSIYDTRVIPNFIIKSLNNENLTIFGDGEQKDSFYYIDDIIKKLINLMSDDNICSPIIIGKPGMISIKELALLIIDIIGSSSQLVFNNSNISELNIPEDDLSLDWEPSTRLKDGLYLTIDYYKNKFK
jgi:UDP-glucuronate decarboxylase